MKIVPFKPGHLDCMDPKDCHEGEIVNEDRFVAYSKMANVRMGTILIGHDPIAVMALMKHREYLAEVFAIVAKDSSQYPVTLFRTARQLLTDQEECLGLTRITMSIKDGYEEGHRWAKALGFEREGLMRNFGPDKTHYHLYARCR